MLARSTAIAAALLAVGCSDPAPPVPPPGAVEKTLDQLEANKQAERADAVAESRAREQERMEAAEERLEKAERQAARRR